VLLGGVLAPCRPKGKEHFKLACLVIDACSEVRYSGAVNVLTKNASLGTLGLPAGYHWVKFHVEGDFISFELAETPPPCAPFPGGRNPTGFIKKWGGTAKKVEDSGDVWLSHINEKHLR
jgi:hypothetical protein